MLISEKLKMPLFNKKQTKSHTNGGTATQNGYEIGNAGLKQGSPPTPPTAPILPPPAYDQCVTKPQLVFHCQLAHGSPTGLITGLCRIHVNFFLEGSCNDFLLLSGFSSVKELYMKIAECYDFPVDEVRTIFKFLANCCPTYTTSTDSKFITEAIVDIDNIDSMNDQISRQQTIDLPRIFLCLEMIEKSEIRTLSSY